MRTHPLAVAAISATALLGLAAPAVAAWTLSGNGTGASSATGFPTAAAAAPSSTVSGSTVQLNFAAVSTIAGDAPATSYDIKRYAAASGGSATQSFTCARAATTPNCSVSPGSGTHFLSVTPRLGSSWVGAESARSTATAVAAAFVITAVTREGGNKKVKFSGSGALATTTITVTVCSVNAFPCASPVTTAVATSPSAGSWTTAATGANLAASATYFAQATQGSATSAVLTFSTTGL